MKLLPSEYVVKALKEGKKIEVKIGKDGEWEEIDVFRMNINSQLMPENLFRLAQEMITIGDVSFPKPEIQTPEIGTKYYTPILCTIQPFDYHTWEDTQIDYKYFKMNLIHLSKENAIAHAKALIKLSGGTYE